MVENENQIVTRYQGALWAFAMAMADRARQLLRQYSEAEAYRLLHEEFLPRLNEYSDRAQAQIQQYVRQISDRIEQGLFGENEQPMINSRAQTPPQAQNEPEENEEPPQQRQRTDAGTSLLNYHGCTQMVGSRG